MAITPVTPIPPAPELPQSTDPATFDARADAYVVWQSDVLAPGIDTQAAATLANAQDAALSATVADNRATDAGTAKQGAEDARDAAGLHEQGAEDAKDSAWAAAAAATGGAGLPQPLQPGKFLAATGSDSVGWVDVPEYSGPGDSRVVVTSPNGMGSINTRIRRYTVAQLNTGTAITYQPSATLGDSFVINEPGIYAVTVVDGLGSGEAIGVSVNSNELTTDIFSINSVNRLFLSLVSSPSAAVTGSRTFRAAAGDVVRVHTGTLASNPTTAVFSIIKVSP